MAWFQNLAVRAEDLLVKIDQNAATVLNEPLGLKNLDKLDSPPQLNWMQKSIERVESAASDTLFLNLLEEQNDELTEVQSNPQIIDLNVSAALIDGTEHEKQYDLKESHSDDSFITFKTSADSTYVKQNSSSLLPEDVKNYEERILKLERHNSDLVAQLLDLQHMHSELKQTNSLLQFELDHEVQATNMVHFEMEEYKARAQRILKEKEKLLLKDDLSQNSVDDSDDYEITTWNEELNQKLQFQKEKNRKLMETIESLNKEVAVLHQEHISVQNTNLKSKASLQESLHFERKLRLNAEDEARIKTKELQLAMSEVNQKQNALVKITLEMEEIKNQFKDYTPLKNNADVESQLHSLTQTLMIKQNNLESVTTERNAYKIQMEKLEQDYQRLLVEKQRSEVATFNVNDTDDVKSRVPKLMISSPFDDGVTRRVKSAYSTLDKVSVRTGVFLRRYPIARNLVFSYMILLHIWMMIVLYNYVP